MTKISVLIPAYNAASYIEAAIKSVQDQTYPAHEIIIVDDGSTDETESLLKNRLDIRYIRCEHRGVSAARNRGIAEAEGDWIAFIDADDLWMPDKLEKQIRYTGEHPDCSIVFTRYENFTDIPVEELSDRQKAVMDVVAYPCVVTALIHKDVFAKYGSFVLKYAYSEDTEWLKRLGFAGLDLSAQIEEVLYLRRIHSSNTTVSHETAGEKEWLALMAEAIRNARKVKKDDQL